MNSVNDESHRIKEKVKHKKATFAALKEEASKILEDLNFDWYFIHYLKTYLYTYLSKPYLSDTYINTFTVSEPLNMISVDMDGYK